jgi:hypothetical protein
MSYFRVAEGIVHTGGVVAATRQQGHDRNWRSPVCPRRNSRKEVSPITVDTGKGLNGSRMAEWPVVATKESNVSGAKGPCWV